MRVYKMNVFCFFTFILNVCLYCAYGQVELARGKKTSVSKQYLGRSTWDSEKVVDGDNNTNVFCGSCLHTEPNREVSAWWQVDLNGTYVISRIEIYNAEPYTPASTCSEVKLDYPEQTQESDRLKGYQVFISDDDVWTSGIICYKDPSADDQYPALYQNNVCEGIGSVITIYNDHMATLNGLNGAALVLCEVKVYGCPVEKYGTNCSSDCPDQCLDKYCKADTGICVQCTDGWLGDNCDVACEDGTYGSNCSMKCGSCDNNEPCMATNGTCIHGCDDGWFGDKCDRECPDGFYGENCSSSCGMCNDNTLCLKNNGTCPSGCQIGYDGMKCKERCKNGTYGDSCADICGSCNNSMSCDHINGSCPDGCNVGWTGEQCQTKCDKGTFGPGCIYKCGNCLNGDVCDHRTGVCPRGCEFGYQTDTCQNICEEGTYGWSCKSKCGNCNESHPCNPINGSCPHGCSPDWEGLKCDISSSTTIQKKQNANLILILPILVVALLIMMIVLIVLIIFLKRRAIQRTVSINAAYENRHDEEERNDKKDGTEYDNIGLSTRISCTEDTITNQETFISSNDDNETNLGLEKDHVLDHEEKTGSYLDMDIGSFELKADDKLYDNESPVTTAMSVADMRHQVAEKKARGILRREFLALSSGTQGSQEEMKTAENGKTTNFLSTFSGDHSSVEKSKQMVHPHTDYITPNYIDGLGKPKAYIATQGPIPTTIHDFWRMIWEAKSGKIVCFMPLEQNEKGKHEKYWPDEGTIQYQNFEIRLNTVKEYSNFAIRCMDAFNTENEESRTIHHYHYFSWPDNEAPDTLELNLFRRLVVNSESALDGPLIVHCSDGIARTGLFVAFDVLLQMGTKDEYIDVFEFVKKTRNDKNTKIQTLDQYIILHDTLVDAFLVNDSAVKTSNFKEIWNNMTSNDIPKNEKRYRKEYQTLNSIRPCFIDNSLNNATSSGNISHNISCAALPDNQFEFDLVPHSDTKNDCVVTVELPSLNTKVQHLATQYPLPNTVHEFWKLVYQRQSPIVIFLEPAKENIQVFPSEDTDVKYGDFVLTSLYKVTSCNGVNEMQMTLKQDGEENHLQLCIIEAQSWMRSENMPPSSKIILEIIQRTNEARARVQKGPTTVVCGNGVTKCGLYCTLSNIVESIEETGEADVLFATRQLQMIRPEFLKDEEQYKFCYTIIHKYLDMKHKETGPECYN